MGRNDKKRDEIWFMLVVRATLCGMKLSARVDRGFSLAAKDQYYRLHSQQSKSAGFYSSNSGECRPCETSVQLFENR